MSQTDTSVRQDCDKCGITARAYVFVTNEKYDLAFCGHHYTEYEPLLVLQGFGVSRDERESLLPAKPSDKESV